MRSIVSRLAILGVSAALWLQPGIPLAGPLIDDTVSTCTGLNCSSLRLPGTVLSFGASAGAWVGQVFARPGECVRLDVVQQGADLEMVVVAPNGTVFRNDDRPGSLLPLVAIANAPNNGWYTVQLAHFAGNGIDTNFVLLYGRYNGGNPNCAGGTAPFSAQALEAEDDESAKPTDGIHAPRRGTPGATD
jgi:hypothetical protein